MKKTILLLAVLLPMVVLAQLKVNQTGRVTIGDDDNFYYPLTVTGKSSGDYTASFNGYKSTMRISNGNQPSVTSSGGGYGLVIQNSFTTTGNSYGMLSISQNGSTDPSALSVGVCGRSRSSTSNAIGVAGLHLTGGGVGTGIFGSATGSIPSFDGCYASYFSGNMKVTGTIDDTLVSSSDARLKEDVQPLSENASNRGLSILDMLESLTPVSFKYKKIEEDAKLAVDDEGEDLETEELPNPVMEKEHFGLIAQELQEVYPNLVYEKDNGYLAVNYVELVPVLMQAIKELNAKVAMLEANKVNCSPLTSGEQETLSLPLNQEQWAGSSMEQNVPNPFTEKTDIAIYLPESVREATLYIYDLSGKQLEQHPIEGRGETVMTIHADKVDAGMYVYSLIADKKVVTTRKMIVVK